ncbi:hypothetical protein MUK42_05718 [Musa troglodytarum]|uniref:Uncharacterized protein n=1 Tax=Musa troglodytarum TaxID=320322 RepID=A0A9E7EWA9_9LILI|nr:hypothetical protein MUK42_05718 [Musa troglodytarum]
MQARHGLPLLGLRCIRPWCQLSHGSSRPLGHLCLLPLPRVWLLHLRCKFAMGSPSLRFLQSRSYCSPVRLLLNLRF